MLPEADPWHGIKITGSFQAPHFHEKIKTRPAEASRRQAKYNSAHIWPSLVLLSAFTINCRTTAARLTIWLFAIAEMIRSSSFGICVCIVLFMVK
jgi:hypothetical protein